MVSCSLSESNAWWLELSSCADRSCAVTLSHETRSTDNTSLCKQHGDFVWAFRPNDRLAEEWFFVSSDKPDEGQVVSGDQCDGCGLSEFVIRKVNKSCWIARCEGQVWDGSLVEGCGALHLVRRKMGLEVL